MPAPCHILIWRYYSIDSVFAVVVTVCVATLSVGFLIPCHNTPRDSY